MKPLEFHEEAEHDLDDSVVYYDRQQEGLGQQFADAVELAVQRIRENPERFQRHEGTEIRKLRMDRFPFTIYFQDLDECVWIVAVAHHKRRKDFWLHRSPYD